MGYAQMPWLPTKMILEASFLFSEPVSQHMQHAASFYSFLCLLESKSYVS